MSQYDSEGTGFMTKAAAMCFIADALREVDSDL